MKKKSLEPRLPYFFGHQIHATHSSGNMHELIKPESEGGRDESENEDILRWADDGGKMLDPGNRTASLTLDAARDRAND